MILVKLMENRISSVQVKLSLVVIRHFIGSPVLGGCGTNPVKGQKNKTKKKENREVVLGKSGEKQRFIKGLIYLRVLSRIYLNRQIGVSLKFRNKRLVSNIIIIVGFIQSLFGVLIFLTKRPIHLSFILLAVWMAVIAIYMGAGLLPFEVVE